MVKRATSKPVRRRATKHADADDEPQMMHATEETQDMADEPEIPKADWDGIAEAAQALQDKLGEAAQAGVVLGTAVLDNAKNTLSGLIGFARDRADKEKAEE